MQNDSMTNTTGGLPELCAARSLAHHLIATGRRMEARDILAPICDWFDPATTLPTLTEARALLVQAS